MPVRYDITAHDGLSLPPAGALRRAPRHVPAARQPRPARARDRSRRQPGRVGAADPGSALELGRAGAAAERAPTRSRSSAAFGSSTRTATTSSCRSRRTPSSIRSRTRSRSATTSSTTCGPYHDDPDGELTAWARQFIRTDGPTGTRDLLIAMNQHIRDHFRYLGRDEEGTQSPIETLRARQRLVPRLRAADDGSGAPPRLRDPLRLGLSLRPCARRRRAVEQTTGAGYTHAWLQAYLPGAGWVPFDPTNNLLGGTQLIRVGIARDPSQAAPIVGQLVRRDRRLPRHDRQRRDASQRTLTLSARSRRRAGAAAWRGP